MGFSWTYYDLLVWFGFNRGHYVVSTGSNVEAMSIPYTRSLQAAESFMVPVLDVYLTPQ